MSELLVASFDIETTGVNERTDLILECAFQVIDPVGLGVRYEAQTLVHHTEELKLDPTVREMHTENKLLEDLKTKVAKAAAGEKVTGLVNGHRGLDMWLADHFAGLEAQPGSIYLTGMSIHFDRKFLAAKCPLACAFLHYRMIDLSTPRELSRMWAELGAPQLPKVEKIPHRAMDDVKLAVKTLAWVQENIWRIDSPLGR